MKIGLIQYSPIYENKESTAKLIDSILETESDSDLIIFPEMSLTGYTINSAQFSEEIDGFGMQYFMKLSSKLRKHIIAGIIERDENRFYNSLYHFSPDGLINARYRKIHPFSFAEEHKSFFSSDETVITKINGLKIGLSICYDLRFPELFRYYGKAKCEIIINIANWPVQRIDFWKLFMRARAAENLCFSIGVNRVGDDPFVSYNGKSCIFDPLGKEIFMSADNTGIYTVEIDPQKVNEVRNKYPFLEDIKLI